MPMTINVQTDQIVSDPRLTVQQLELAHKRARADTLRALQTIGRREARTILGLPAGSINRRVKAYIPSQRLWFGANPVALLRFPGVRLKAPQKPNKHRGHTILNQGRVIPNAFARKTGRFKNTPFQSVDRNVLTVLKRDIKDGMGQAFEATMKAVPATYDRIFTLVVRRTLRPGTIRKV